MKLINMSTNNRTYVQYSFITCTFIMVILCPIRMPKFCLNFDHIDSFCKLITKSMMFQAYLQRCNLPNSSKDKIFWHTPLKKTIDILSCLPRDSWYFHWRHVYIKNDLCNYLILKGAINLTTYCLSLASFSLGIFVGSKSGG